MLHALGHTLSTHRDTRFGQVPRTLQVPGAENRICRAWGDPSLGLQETSEQPAAEVTKCFESQQITSIKLCGSDRFEPCSNIGFFNF